MKTQTAKLKYLSIAPRKVRLVASTVKGMTIAEAQAQLLLRPQRAAVALLKLLNSAVAGAKNNQQLSPENLRVVGIRVDVAPVLKRSLPRAQGRATSIFKRMSHVTVELAELSSALPSRFVITAPEKKKKEVVKKKRPTRLANEEEQKKDPEHSRPEKKLADTKEQVKEFGGPKTKNPGFVKKLFNRKAI